MQNEDMEIGLPEKIGTIKTMAFGAKSNLAQILVLSHNMWVILG